MSEALATTSYNSATPRHWLRAVVVALLVLYAWLYHLPTVLNLTSHPYIGGLGIVWNRETGIINEVTVNSRAAHAGLHVGDRIDVANAASAVAWRLENARVLAGKEISLPIVTRNGFKKDVPLTPVPWYYRDLSPISPYLLPAIALQCIIASALAGALYLLKPSVMTGAFLAYGLLTVNNLEILSFAPDRLLPAAAFIDALTAGVGFAGLTIFFFRFPSGEPLQAWRTIEKICVAAVMLLAVPLYFFRFVERAEAHIEFSRVLYNLFTIVCWSAIATAFAAALARYKLLDKSEQVRVRWVVLGFATLVVSFFIFFIEHVRRPELSHYSVWWTVGDWAVVFNLMVPTVVYAVLRHHVLGIRIIGARAAVYTLVTSVPLVLLTVTSGLIGEGVKKSPLFPAAQIVLSALLAYCIAKAKKPVDKLTRQIFLRKRTVNEDTLRDRVASARWESIEALQRVLVDGISQYLDIASVALFERDGESFKRTLSIGWDGTARDSFDANSAEVVELANADRPVGADRFARISNLPTGDCRPILAVPILGRDGLRAFLFVGAHTDGEALDADERKTLSHIAASAKAAYEANDSARERATIEELRKEVGILRARFA